MAPYPEPRIGQEPLAGTAGWAGWTAALFSAVAFSIAPVISRYAIVGGLDATNLVLARMVGTLILMLAFMGLAAPDRLRMPRAALQVALLAGMVNGVGFLTFFWALARLEAGLASMLFSVNPLLVLGLLALRGERLTRRHLVRVGLGLAGIYLLVGPGGQADATGVLLVLATVVSFSLMLVMVQWYLQPYEPWGVTLYLVLGITVVVAAGWLLQRPPWQEPGPAGWTAIITLIVVCTFFARLAWLEGVRRLGSGQISLLSPLETFLTAGWSVLFLQERLTAAQWAGGGLILLSMFLAGQRLSRTRVRLRWRVWPKW